MPWPNLWQRRYLYAVSKMNSVLRFANRYPAFVTAKFVVDIVRKPFSLGKYNGWGNNLLERANSLKHNGGFGRPVKTIMTTLPTDGSLSTAIAHVSIIAVQHIVMQDKMWVTIIISCFNLRI